jgi:hypothetical protein
MEGLSKNRASPANGTAGLCGDAISYVNSRMIFEEPCAYRVIDNQRRPPAVFAFFHNGFIIKLPAKALRKIDNVIIHFDVKYARITALPIKSIDRAVAPIRAFNRYNGNF